MVATRATNRAGLGTEEVLVVEDEQTARRRLGVLLSSCGYRTRAFETGEQALAWLEEQHAHPRAALVDLDLPGMDGLELIASMENVTPDMLALLVTATDEQTLSRRLS